MEEENFLVSFIAAIFGVLPILFFSIIACERKKSRKASTPPYQKPPTSSKVVKEAPDHQEPKNKIPTTTQKLSSKNVENINGKQESQMNKPSAENVKEEENPFKEPDNQEAKKKTTASKPSESKNVGEAHEKSAKKLSSQKPPKDVEKTENQKPQEVPINANMSKKSQKESSKTSKSSESKSKSVKETSGHLKPENETSTTTIQRPSTSNVCIECQRFDEALDAAFKSTTGIKVENTDGRFCINKLEITPKKCEHGNDPNIITVQRPELQMSTFIGNGTVLSICGDSIQIIKTNMGKANLTIGGNCNTMIYGNVIMSGNNNGIMTGNNNVIIYVNGKRWDMYSSNNSTPKRSKAIECLECSKYDEKIATTSKATIIRDSTGRMIIISSTGMDIVNQNGQDCINGDKIESKSCKHDDINCCSIYYSSNLKGFRKCSIYYSSNIDGKNCSIYSSSNVTGNGCSIYKSSNVTGNGCSIYNSSKVNGKKCSIYSSKGVDAISSTVYSSSNVNGDGCTIYSSSTINTNDCTLYSCSTVNTKNCVKYSCTNASGKSSSCKKKFC